MTWKSESLLLTYPQVREGLQEIVSGCAFSFADRCAHIPSCSYSTMTVLMLSYSAGSPGLLIHGFKGVECQRFF